MPSSSLSLRATGASVKAFLEAVENETRRKDGRTLLKMFKEVTGQHAKMWGPSIIGFGTYHYKYESGCEGTVCLMGFSPRKASLSLYLGPCFSPRSPLLSKLGKHKLGNGGCLYINKLADVDQAVLEKLIAKSVAEMRKRYDCD